MRSPHLASLGFIVVAALIANTAAPVSAGVTPEQQCQAAKNKTAGKYAACRQKAESKLATSGDAVEYNDALTKC